MTDDDWEYRRQAAMERYEFRRNNQHTDQEHLDADMANRYRDVKSTAGGGR